MAANETATNMSAMAFSASKLQASAREFIKNFEEVLTPASKKEELKSTSTSPPKDSNTGSSINVVQSSTAQLESAFKVMFGSCTTGTTGKDATLSDLGSSCSIPDECTPKPRSVSETKRRCTSEGGKDIGEHIYAQLFLDDQVRAARAINTTKKSSNPAGIAAVTPDEKKKDGSSTPANRIFAPFPTTTAAAFLNKSPSAVANNAVRQQQQQHSSPLRSKELNIPANATFDDSVSAISAHTLECMHKKYQLHQSQKEQQHEKVDEQIRKIMTITPSRTHSNGSSTLFPESPASSEEREENNYNQDGITRGTPARCKAPKSSMEPDFSLSSKQRSLSNSRRRSSGSSRSSSKNSAMLGQPSKFDRNGSSSTKTTGTSASSAMDRFMWQQEEKRYWEDVTSGGANSTNKEKRGRSLKSKSPYRERRSSRDPSTRKSLNDLTLSTAANSSRSSAHGSTWSANFDKHPHDTFHYSPGDFLLEDNNDPVMSDAEYPFGEEQATFRNAVQNDPSRINQVLFTDLPSDSEVMEI